ncbi:MAG: tetratricopeptide repeat protein [Candidatus Latescibacteria bacterium]|nr:tetratricopeptide repeat protein [Candidatus Latescibacterota bacterium]
MRAGKTGEAQSYFRRARAIHRLLGKQFTDIGQGHFERGTLDTAKIAFVRALEYDTQNPLSNLGLGRTYLREKNYTDAITYLSRALLLDPDLSDARDLLKQALKKHRQSDLTSHLRHYTFPCQALAFKEGDSLRVEIAYALPKVGLAAAGGVGVVHIDQHLSFQSETDTAILSFTERLSYLPEVGKASLRENYLLGTHTVQIPLNTYQLSLNIKDRKIASLGTFQTVCHPPTDEIDFGMSDHHSLHGYKKRRFYLSSTQH